MSVSSIGRRVTMLFPLPKAVQLPRRLSRTQIDTHLGRNSCPTIASNTELLPELWLPITTMLGSFNASLWSMLMSMDRISMSFLVRCMSPFCRPSPSSPAYTPSQVCPASRSPPPATRLPAHTHPKIHTHLVPRLPASPLRWEIFYNPFGSYGALFCGACWVYAARSVFLGGPKQQRS